MSKRSMYVPVIFLVLIASSALPVDADVDFDIIRPVFDQIIEEKEGGVNYIRINREGFTGDDIFDARPKLSSFMGSLDPNKIMEILAREGAIKEVEKEFLRVLPELEGSIGLEFWATIVMWDEEPPALYIGLYRPTESQLRAVAEAMENVTRSHGVIIRFYEALSPKSLEDKLTESGDSLAKSLDSEQWDPEIPLPIIGTDISGALEVIVNYTATGRTYPDKEYVMKVIKAVRGVVGHEIPVIFSFPKWVRTGLDILYQETPGSQAPWLPILITLFALSTAGYVALRRTRKGPKRWSRLLV